MKDLTIILAEDDDGCSTLLRRNLARARPGVQVVPVRDGIELVEYVRRGGPGPRRPALLLLDIRMPGLDGIEVLRQIKSDPVLRALPVYMLTTSDNPVDIARCFELGCNAYLTKPISAEGFAALIERLCAFIEITEIPAAPECSHASA